MAKRSAEQIQMLISQMAAMEARAVRAEERAEAAERQLQSRASPDRNKPSDPKKRGPPSSPHAPSVHWGSDEEPDGEDL